MEINESKLKRQLLGINKWRVSKKHKSPFNGCGTFKYPTGMGKTYTALLIVRKLLDNIDKYKDYDYIAHISVPTEHLKFQWVKEIEKHIPSEHQDKLNVLVVNSVLLELRRPNVVLNIIDEVHEFYSDERFKVVDGTIIKYKFLLCLSATPEDMNNREEKLYKICPIVDEISFEYALKEGWVSKFKEYNLGIKLNEKEQILYNRYSSNITELLDYFQNDYQLAQKCLSGGKDGSSYRYSAFEWAETVAASKGWTARDRFHEHNPRNVINMAKALNANVKKRKDIVYMSDDKVRVIKNICDKFPELKTICFSQSTKFADKLGSLLNEGSDEDERCVVYHTKLTPKYLLSPKTNKTIKYGVKRLKDRAISMIKDGSATVLSTASGLDNGLDISDIRCGITSSGTANPTQYQQRRGRAIRVEDISDIYDGDVIVLLVNVYFKNTNDEKSLLSRQYNQQHKINWIESIDEIDYIPQPIRNRTKVKQITLKL